MNMIDKRLQERITELTVEIKADADAKAFNLEHNPPIGERRVSMSPYVLEGQKQLLEDLIARQERRNARC